MDSARLSVFVRLKTLQPFILHPNLSLWVHDQQCIDCLPQFFASLENDRNNTKVPAITTNFPQQIFVKDSDQTLCNLTKKFNEHGIYWVSVEGEAGTGLADCCCYATDEGRHPALFILYAFIVFLGLFAIFFVIKSPKVRAAWNTFVSTARSYVQRGTINSDLGVNNPSAGLLAGSARPTNSSQAVSPSISKKRLRSLDAFRGLSIVIMIFVNYEGGGYWYFKHSAWNGLTVADLVFPWFMFIMGVSMAISMKSMVRRATPWWQLLFRVVKRSVLLFLLGLMLNSGKTNDLTKLRIPGVLQRFSVTYLFLSVLEIVFFRDSDVIPQTWWAPYRDLVESWPQWMIMTAVVALHTAFTFGLEVPGCPKGYLGPGGLHKEGRFNNCTGGAAGYIDRYVFGNGHIYSHPTCMKVYMTNVPYDPEGLLGCLTAALMVFLGLTAGKIIGTYGHSLQRIKRFAIWGVFCGVVSLVLTRGKLDEGWIPINKNLWSLSFVMAMASMSFFLLIFMFYVIDVKAWWSGCPLVYPGMNAIVLFMGHEILENYFPFRWKTQHNHEMILFFSCWGATIWTFFAYLMYKRKIFISL